MKIYVKKMSESGPSKFEAGPVDGVGAYRVGRGKTIEAAIGDYIIRSEGIALEFDEATTETFKRSQTAKFYHKKYGR